MFKSDNPQAARFCASLEKHIGEKEANYIDEKFTLKRTADADAKFKWAKDMCIYLDNHYPEEDIIKIRKDCSCSPGEKAERVKELYESSADMNEFCEKFNREYAPGNQLSFDGKAVYLMYPNCYCSCVKRATGRLTKAWCYCSLGYAEKMFSRAFGREVKTALIESCLTGGSKCVMQIRFA